MIPRGTYNVSEWYLFASTTSLGNNQPRLELSFSQVLIQTSHSKMLLPFRQILDPGMSHLHFHIT